MANPLLEQVGEAEKRFAESGYNAYEYWWFVARCSKCRSHTLFYGKRLVEHQSGAKPSQLFVVDQYPRLSVADEELPPMASKYFQQALESKHAPDGAVMLAASSIDAMLKDKGYIQDSLFTRIEEASQDGVLTRELAAWAHVIRLSANEPRHADEDFTGFSDEDAEQVIAFAKALGEYLYVLPVKVARWKRKAEEPKSDGTSH